MKLHAIATLIVFAACGFAVLAAQDGLPDIGSDRWTVTAGKTVEFLGRKAFMGSASLKGVEFENGVIESDVAVPAERPRSYPGLTFRAAPDGSWERFCIRPHRSPYYPDAAPATADGPYLGQKPDLATIEKNIRASIAWALTKDRPLLESVMAHDERLFMFNPSGKNTEGWADLEKNFTFWMDPRFKTTVCEIRDLRIDLSRSGDVAWWSCRLDDIGEWDGKPIGWKDVRWTGVIEKRDGRWVIVQMHFSYPAERFRQAKD